MTATAEPPTIALWCPYCLTTVGDAEVCPRCGFVETTPDVTRLREIVSRLGDISRQSRALAEQQRALVAERDALFRHAWAEGPSPAPAGAAAPRRPRREVRVENVRNALLVLGALLVVVAATIFAGYAWSRLGDTGRGALLVVLTVIIGVTALGLRRRLPATAETLSVLTLGFVLVDWYVVQVGFGSSISDLVAWWAAGTAVTALIGAAAGVPFRAPRAAAAALGAISASLSVLVVADAAWTVALGIAVVSLALTGAALAVDRAPWRAVPLPVLVGAATFTGLIAGIAALGAVPDSGASAVEVCVTYAVLAVAAATPVVVARGRLAERSQGLLAGTATVLALAACVQGVVDVVPDPAVVVIAAALGVVGMAAARRLPRHLWSGTAVAGAAYVGLPLFSVVPMIAEALVMPLRWVGEAWTARGAWVALDHLLVEGDTSHLDGGGTAVVALSAVALLVAAGGLDVRRMSSADAAGASGVADEASRRLLPARAVLLLGAPAATFVAMAPLAARAPITAVAALEVAVVALVVLGASFGLAGERRVAALAGAALLGVPALGWSLAFRPGTLVALPVLAIVTAVAATRPQTAATRSVLAAVAAALALGEVAAIACAAGAAVATISVAIAVAVAVLLLAAALVPQLRAVRAGLLEVVGSGGLAAALVVATIPSRAASIDLTVVALALTTAALARRSAPHAVAAGAAALAAVWLWLWTFEVAAVEPYTLPAAALALAAGWYGAHRGGTRPSSWTVLGPGLALGLAPSLAVVLAEGGVARPVLLAVGATAVLVAGARARLQAPLTLGALVLAVLAVDSLGPHVVALPRWITLGATGTFLLWLGATAEHRMLQLRAATARYRRLA
jgi:hypothetical protein